MFSSVAQKQRIDKNNKVSHKNNEPITRSEILLNLTSVFLLKLIFQRIRKVYPRKASLISLSLSLSLFLSRFLTSSLRDSSHD